jgi:hypothetical protein
MDSQSQDAPKPEQVGASFEKQRTDLVTLVFTDLVDSTALMQTMGDQAGAAFLQRRRQTVRDTLKVFAEGGEIETAGDSFLIVFSKPSDAVRFSLLLQSRFRSLTTEGTIPNNPQWVFEEKLGEGGFGEVWVAQNPRLKARHVFKFCFRADRVRTLKRELTLFRVLKEPVGDHPGIVRLYDVYLEEPPYYLEEEFVDGKDLKTWCEQHGGAANIPQQTKLEIIAQAADALQAAHDAGVNRLFAYGSSRLRIFDLMSHKSWVFPEDHYGHIMCIEFSPDGKTVATGSVDHSVKLWSLAARRVAATLEGHSGPVSGLAFSPDGTLLASASRDGTVRIWRAIPQAILGATSTALPRASSAAAEP